MIWNIGIKRALSDFGPIRKNGIYIVYEMDNFLRVEITDFTKSKHVDIKPEDVIFEDVVIDNVDTQKALSMLRGEAYYPEYSNSASYAHVLIDKVSYTLEDFMHLIDKLGDEITIEQAFAIGNLNDLYLAVTKEGSIASQHMFNYTDPNIDKIESKISAMLLAICLYFEVKKVRTLKTSKIKEEMMESIELSKKGEHKGAKIPSLFRIAQKMLKLEHEVFTGQDGLFEKIIKEESDFFYNYKEKEEFKA